MFGVQELTTKCNLVCFFLASSSLLCDITIMNEILLNLQNRMNELDQIIDLETEPAEAGSTFSRMQVINAEIEKEELTEQLEALALWCAFSN